MRYSDIYRHSLRSSEYLGLLYSNLIYIDILLVMSREKNLI